VLRVHINNAHIQKVLEVHLHRVYETERKSRSESSRKPDELVLSARAKEMQDIKQAAASLPEVRANVVQSLKRRIQSGNYDLDADELAASILGAVTPTNTDK